MQQILQVRCLSIIVKESVSTYYLLLAKVCFKGLCWLQRMSYKPTHKERTPPSHPIEKSTVVHDALLFHPHHPIFSNTAKIFSYSLVVNLGTSLEKYCKNHTLWSKVDLLQVQTGDRWYYKVSFSFSCLFHGNRLQNRKQNRSLLLQGGGAVQCCIRVFNLGERMFQLRILTLKKNDL